MNVRFSGMRTKDGSWPGAEVGDYKNQFPLWPSSSHSVPALNGGSNLRIQPVDGTHYKLREQKECCQ